MENFKKFFAGALTLAITFGIFTVFSFSSGDEFLGRVNVKSQDNGQKVQRVKRQRAQNVERTKTTRQRRATRNTATYKESSKRNVQRGKRINRATQSDAAYKKRSRQNVRNDQRNTTRRANTAAREARLKQVCSKYFSANNGLQRQLSQRQEERLKKICDQYSNSNQGNEQRDKENEKPTPPDSNPVIETYIGACNDPFGSPSCVVEGEYTTDDLELGSGQLVYTMRVTNTSSTTPMYMDKVFVEYDMTGLDPAVWSRTDWKIYENSPSGTLLTRGVLLPSGNVSFDWAFPGSDHHPVNQPPVIPPNGSQIYAVTVNLVDDAIGFDSADYVQVRADDSSTFTPITGGTLAQARGVNSHFIWHDDAGRYYNEAYVDLMDMWGSVASATAQWRKREYSAVEPSGPVTIEFTELPAGEPYSSIIMPGDDYKVADIDITATTEDIYLDRLVLHNDDMGILDFSDTFETFYLTDSDESIIDMSPMTGSSTEDDEIVFTGFISVPDVLIPAGTTKHFEVHTEVAPVFGTTNTGNWLNLYVEDASSYNVTLRTLDTDDIVPSSVITNNAEDGDPFQQEHFVHATEPTVEVFDAITGLITGTTTAKKVYTFRISADPLGDIEWNRVAFNIDETAGLESSNYRLYVLGTEEAGYPPLNTVPASVVGGKVVIDTDVVQSVPGGGFTEYALHANTVLTDVTTDQKLDVTITSAADTAAQRGTAAYVRDIPSDFVWSDRSYSSHDISTTDWMNGYSVETFDEDTLTTRYIGTGDEAAGLRFIDYYASTGEPYHYVWINPYRRLWMLPLMTVAFEADVPMTIPSVRIYMDGTLETDGAPVVGGFDNHWLEPYECTNLSELSAVLNRKFPEFGADDADGGHLDASSSPVFATSGEYHAAPSATDGGPTCSFRAYVDLDLGSTVFDGYHEVSPTATFDYFWPFEQVRFSLQEPDETTVALLHPSGTTLPSGLISPTSGFFEGETKNVDTRVRRTTLLRLLFDMTDTELPAATPPYACPDALLWMEDIWDTAIDLGIIGPYTDEHGDPTACGVFDVVNRAEAAKVLFTYGNSIAGTVPLSDPLGVFPDVPAAAWFASFVDSLFAVGVPVGFPSGMFLPGENLNFIDWHNWISELP